MKTDIAKNSLYLLTVLAVIVAFVLNQARSHLIVQKAGQRHVRFRTFFSIFQWISFSLGV